MKMSGLNYQVLISTLFNATSQIILFFGITWLGGAHGVDAMGKYGTIASIGSFLGISLMLRAELSLITAERKEFINNSTIVICYVFCLLCVVLLLNVFLYDFEFYTIAYFSVGIFLIYVSQTLMSNLKKYILSSFFKLISILTFVVLSVKFGSGDNIAELHAMSLLLCGLLFLIGSKKSVFDYKHINKDALIKFWASSNRYVKFTFPSSLINGAIGNLFPSIVYVLFGSFDAGLVFMLMRISMAPITVLGTSIGQIVRREFVSLKYDPEKFRINLTKLVYALTVCAIIYLVCVILFFEYLLIKFLGEEWHTLSELYPYFLFYPITMIFYVPLSQLYLLFERQNIDLYFQGVLFVTVGLCLFSVYSLDLTAQSLLSLYSFSISFVYWASIYYIMNATKKFLRLSLSRH